MERQLRGNESFPSTKYELSLRYYVIILRLITVMMSDHPTSLKYHVPLSPRRPNLLSQLPLKLEYRHVTEAPTLRHDDTGL